MEVFDIKKTKGFSVITNYHLRDNNLSLKAKGLLTLMLSLPENWDYSFKGLVSICKENKDAIRATINELKKYNYITITMDRTERGTFKYKYTVYEHPSQLPFMALNEPRPDFPVTVNPFTENPHQINNNIINTKEIIDIDKIDKTLSEVKRTRFTEELIRIGYTNENDPYLDFYDNLYNYYLSEGRSQIDICAKMSYVVRKIKGNEFKDADGKNVISKYGYLKNAMDNNFACADNMPDELYPEEPKSKNERER